MKVTFSKGVILAIAVILSKQALADEAYNAAYGQNKVTDESVAASIKYANDSASPDVTDGIKEYVAEYFSAGKEYSNGRGYMSNLYTNAVGEANLNLSKAFTQDEINKLRNDLNIKDQSGATTSDGVTKAYIDNADNALRERIQTYYDTLTKTQSSITETAMEYGNLAGEAAVHDANEYTDDEIAKLKKQIGTGSGTSTVNDGVSKDYVDSQDEKVSKAANKYADEGLSSKVDTVTYEAGQKAQDDALATASTEAKAHADQAAKDAQSAAVTHSDSELSKAKAEGKDYSDKVATDTLTAANGHADKAAATAESNAVNTANAHTDAGLSGKVDTTTYEAGQKAQDDALATASTEAKAHADQAATQALGTSKVYTDTTVRASEANTKGYTVTEVRKVKDESTAYANQASTAAAARAEKSANGYTDDQISKINVNTDHAYTDRAKAEAVAHSDNRADADRADSIARDQAVMSVSQSYTDVRTGQAVNQANSYTDARFGEISKSLKQTEKKLSSGIAGVAAMSALPYADNLDFSYGVGAAAYNGESALAVGAQLKVGERTRVRLQGSAGSDGKPAVAVGVTSGFNF